MNFLHPLFLYALPLATLPVIIHLFTRRKRIVIPFSTLRFLKIIENKRIKRLRIQQWILLILRTATIIFIVLAFSRPVKRGAWDAAGGGTKTAAVLIVDNSLSMGATIGNNRIFETAAEYAGNFYDAFAPGDEIYVLFPSRGGNQTHERGFSSRDEAFRSIPYASLSFERADLASALAEAQELLENESTAANKEIYVFSDLQLSEFDFDKLPGDELHEGRISHFFVDVGGEFRENTGVTGLRMHSQIFEPDKNVDIEIAVSSYGAAFPRETVLNVFLEGKRVAQRVVAFKEQATQQIFVSLTPPAAGIVQGFVETEPDQLDEDNRRYFTFHIPEETSVLFVSPDPVRSSFFKTAVAPDNYGGRSNVRIESVAHPLPARSFDKHHVLIYYDIAAFNPADIVLIRDYLRSGRGALIALTERTDLASYNSVIAEALSLPAGSARRADSRDRDAGYFSIERIQLEHPVFYDMFEKKPEQFGPVHIFGMTMFPPDTSANVLVSVQNGAPLVSEFRRENGRIIMFAGGVTTASSDFPLKGLFAPLVHRSVKYLAQDIYQLHENFIAGSPLRFTSDRKAESFEVERPDGRREKPNVEIKDNRYVVTYANTSEPGLYSLYLDGKIGGMSAVNIDSRESDPSRIDTGVLKEKFSHVRFLPLSKAESLEIIRESRYGMELTRYVLIGVFLLLGAEMWIARFRKEEEPLETPEQIIATHV